MGMFAGLTNTMKDAKDKYHLTEAETIQLFIDIMGCLEWDLDGVDYNGDDWPEQERVAAKKALEL
tara:strand:+ start:144 stop:338 length:195 start_codon:yes stop_codon:yes gene_type:complete